MIWRERPEPQPVPTACQAEGADRAACAGRPACEGCADIIAARVAAVDRVRDAVRRMQPSTVQQSHAPAAGNLVDPAELIGAQEVCAMCGWKTRKSIGDAHGFPAPVATVSGTRLWTRTQVNEWKANR